MTYLKVVSGDPQNRAFSAAPGSEEQDTDPGGYVTFLDPRGPGDYQEGDLRAFAHALLALLREYICRPEAGEIWWMDKHLTEDREQYTAQLATIVGDHHAPIGAPVVVTLDRMAHTVAVDPHEALDSIVITSIADSIHPLPPGAIPKN